MSVDTLLIALLIVGVLQGILEWLPVSSEAFIFIILLLFDVPAQMALIIAILMHLPTGFAAILYYRNDYFEAIRNLASLKFDPITRFLVIGTLFTALSAVPIYFALKIFLAHLEATIKIASLVIFILIGIAMITTAIYASRTVSVIKHKNLWQITFKDSAITGFLQGFAIIPGVSRSGTTIATLLWRGLNQEDSLRGSFLLGGIISIASFFFLYLSADINPHIIPIHYYIVPMISAFAISLLSIDFLVKLAGRISYPKFLLLMGTLILSLSIIALLIINYPSF